MEVSTLPQRKILGVIYNDPWVKMICARHLSRLGCGMVAVQAGDQEALETLELYVDAILVDDEKLATSCQKPLLITTKPTQESLFALLYN